MAQLRRDYNEFVKRDTVILVAGPDDREAFTRYWRENDLPFIGLPDPDHGILKRYGQEVNLFRLGRLPAQLLVDKSGMARFVHYGHAMSDIPSNPEMIELIGKIGAG
jgi:peroxiredoxin Q/BCP